eukprot:TRINITY_DN15074_c0_g2_i1.p1 TRINITY_DN15074_c0_g2~~TRINITY_DN15074_c0_g2_i1.p1  ORF type:complete len:214 (-),score=42.77 TRINITY_DN15074_c0_g2_i1:34-675(-)
MSVVKILAFGDSLTEGYAQWGSVWHPYADRLQILLNERSSSSTSSSSNNNDNNDNNNITYQVDCAGISGEQSRSMVKRIKKLVAHHDHHVYDIVIVLGGTNDLHFLDSREIFNNLVSIHHHIAQMGSKSVVVTIPEVENEQVKHKHISDRRKEVNALLLSYSQEFDLPFFDLSSAIPHSNMTPDQELLWDDSLHFSTKGYDKIADLLYALLWK